MAEERDGCAEVVGTLREYVGERSHVLATSLVENIDKSFAAIAFAIQQGDGNVEDVQTALEAAAGWM